MLVNRLAGVHPDLVTRVQQIQIALTTVGHPLQVTAGVRTDEAQAALYAKGRTTPGPIVTHADGVIHRSNHQVQADGFGHAVDCAFVVNGQPSWDDSLPWALYGLLAETVGLVWGGRWSTIRDRPHVELPH